MKNTIAIAAGGTGGHIFPAQAICELLNKRYYILWFTDQKGQKFMKPIDDCKVVILPVTSIATTRGDEIQFVYGLARLAISIVKAMYTLTKNKVKLVVGFGGYPAAPVLCAAFILRIPTVIHEQNAIMGRVNRFFSKPASSVMTSFEKTIHAPSNAVYVGNPIRQSIAKIAEIKLGETKNTGAFNPIRILVIGGSQGSALLSSLVPSAIAKLPEELKTKIYVTQQTRPELIDVTRKSYPKIAELVIASFFDDIGEKMASSDIIIARAGATTIAELSYLRKPAILIPLVSAKDNHQYYNAKYLADQGGAIILEEKDKGEEKALNPEILAKLIEDMINNLPEWASKAKKTMPSTNALANMVTKINQIIMYNTKF